MYYEESMINGVLCWRSTPDGEWTPFTVAELSTRVQRELKTEIAQLKAELAKLQEWQQIILGSGTDKEAVIRMAATKYTEVAVQSWREEVGKLKAELAEAKARGVRLRALLRDVVQCFCVTQNPDDYPVDSWINKALAELRRLEEVGI